jgi:N-carbamoylputrescine amidase
MSRIVNIGLIQMSCDDDVQSNFNSAVAGIRDAAGRGAQMVCLQELFKSRYFCQVVDEKYLSLGPNQ